MIRLPGEARHLHFSLLQIAQTGSQAQIANGYKRVFSRGKPAGPEADYYQHVVSRSRISRAIRPLPTRLHDV